MTLVDFGCRGGKMWKRSFNGSFLCDTFTNMNLLIDHFARCKQHWSRSTSFFSFL